MSPHNSQLVTCGGGVVVVVVRNTATVGDVVAIVSVVNANNVVVMVGAAAAAFVWVQRCLMRPCTSPQFDFVSVVVTPTGKESSWWDQ